MTTTGFRIRTRGLWALTAAFSFAIVSGCGGGNETEGLTTPTEEQVKAQNNMADFMKSKGKTPKKAASQ